MRYAQIRNMDISNGEGVGVSLFVQGCPIHCKGCFNPETWDFELGKEWNKEIENKFLDIIGKDYIKRISILGGSPLCDENVKDVDDLVCEIRKKYPDKQIWVYTGYEWEDIFDPEFHDSLPFKFDSKYYRSDILEHIDVLVDGPFEYNKRDLTLAFRGSNNQRIIDVQRSIESGKVILWNNEDKGEY